MADNDIDINALMGTAFVRSLRVGQIILDPHSGNDCWLVTSLEGERLGVFSGTAEEVKAKKRELGI